MSLLVVELADDSIVNHVSGDKEVEEVRYESM